MKRAIRINFNDGSPSIDLELSKATLLKIDDKMIHLDEMRDGSYRLIFSQSIISDFSKVANLEVIREDDEIRTVNMQELDNFSRTLGTCLKCGKDYYYHYRDEHHSCPYCGL